jgi:hypothetical protein
MQRVNICPITYGIVYPSKRVCLDIFIVVILRQEPKLKFKYTHFGVLYAVVHVIVYNHVIVNTILELTYCIHVYR